MSNREVDQSRAGWRVAGEYSPGRHFADLSHSLPFVCLEQGHAFLKLLAASDACVKQQVRADELCRPSALVATRALRQALSSGQAPVCKRLQPLHRF
jgi:hypothetical protein